MLGDNLKLLKSLKEDTQKDMKRATNLLVKYGDVAYGENVDYNSEEAQDASVIHDALEHYLNDLSSDIHSIERQIAREEKKVKKLKASNVLFRPHRGGLADAMSEIKEFKSEKELREYVAAREKEYGYDTKPEDIKITLYGELSDDRIGWPQSYLVEGHGIVGFLTYGVALEDSLKAYEEFLNRR